MNCLWTGEPSENPFVLGGGKLRQGAQNHLENGKFTKNFAMNDFITILKMSLRLGIDLTKEEKTYLSFREDLLDWYESLPEVN